jgi:hypothetical protein
MLWICDVAEIEIFSQGRNQMGAMLLPNDVIKHLELLSFMRGMVSPDEHILKAFKGEDDEELSEPSE